MAKLPCRAGGPTTAQAPPSGRPGGGPLESSKAWPGGISGKPIDRVADREKAERSYKFILGIGGLPPQGARMPEETDDYVSL